MKSQRRHELQTNELADALGRLVERARPHGRTIALGAGVVILAVVVLIAVPVMRSRSAEAVAAAFNLAVRAGEAEAVRTFLERYPEAEQAGAARLLLADRLLADVSVGPTPQEGADPTRDEQTLAEAERLYTEVADASADLEPMARVGLALVTLERGRLDEGRKALGRVAETWPQSIAAARAKVHLDRLAGYEPVAFSDEPLERPTAPEDVQPDAAGEAEADVPAMPPLEPPTEPSAVPAEPGAESPAEPSAAPAEPPSEGAETAPEAAG